MNRKWHRETCPRCGKVADVRMWVEAELLKCCLACLRRLRAAERRLAKKARSA